MTLDEQVRAICKKARDAARKLSPRPRAEKDAALEAIARALGTHAADVLRANAADLEAARDRGTKGALLDRLMLDEARLAGMAESVRQIAALPDPVGEVVSRTTREDGLRIARVRVPLGVIAMIYEARPNVTVDASALTFKAGNAVVLRGGSEAARSNAALAEILMRAIESVGLPSDAVAVLPFTDRDGVRALIQQSDFVDLAIPRGGEALIRYVTENARVPVVQHYKGVCHIFLDAGVDIAMATRVVMNAKMQRPGVCNAVECLLVDAKDAARVLSPVANALLSAGCELRGDAQTCALVPAAKPASEDDWGREFLDTVLAVRVVDGLDAALAHIAEYGSGHTEAILTPNAAHAERFRREVDAACVAVNASTRFHDGGQFGLGAEIGIATSRVHWRGPMGLEALTTMKWIVDGEGHVRA
ncbi:MAG: glutamate-5-semialdehyde dehydrogenase [Polyangiaceae bacterium]|nr:glutamate-5-semialdehyde dehydrogenase [Polyangiaceae bacterium]